MTTYAPSSWRAPKQLTHVDYNTFKKTPKEKKKLAILKSQLATKSFSAVARLSF